MLRIVGGTCCLLLALGLQYAGVIGVLPKLEPATPALTISFLRAANEAQREKAGSSNDLRAANEAQ